MAVLSTSANIATPGLPVGSIQAFAGANAPTGWLLCDGSAVSRGNYPDLYNTIGNTYGSGDGSTTFNLPDLRGRMPIGAGTDGTASNVITRIRGEKGGDYRLQQHQHYPMAGQTSRARMIDVDNPTGTGTSAGGPYIIRDVGTTGNVTPDTATSTTGQNMPPFLVTNYIIKAVADIARGGWYTQSSPPVVTQLPTNPAIGEEYYYINPTTGGYQHIKWTGSAWTTFNDSIFSPDSSGRTRRPYQPAFIAKTPAAYNHNSVVPASNVQLNVGNHYNNSTYRFTAPVAGIYVFIFHEIGQSNTSTYRYNLRKNGSQVTNETGYEVRIASYNNWGDGTGVWLQNVAVNDYFDVFYTSDGGFQSYGTLTYGFFGGYFLG